MGDITGIDLSATQITEIGNSAFYGCTSLESITLPEGLTTIGNNAFTNCTSLETVTLPRTVTEIASSAFWGCTNLTSINLEVTKIKTIGINTLNECT